MRDVESGEHMDAYIEPKETVSVSASIIVIIAIEQKDPNRNYAPIKDDSSVPILTLSASLFLDTPLFFILTAHPFKLKVVAAVGSFFTSLDFCWL